jgi:hypothetical protein
MDFSFTYDIVRFLPDCSVLDLHQPPPIYASTYIKVELVPKKIRKVVINTAKRLRKRGLSVQFGVDAMNLQQTLDFSGADVRVYHEMMKQRRRTVGASDGLATVASTPPPSLSSSSSSTSSSSSSPFQSHAPSKGSGNIFSTVVFCFPRARVASGDQADNYLLFEDFFRSCDESALLPVTSNHHQQSTGHSVGMADGGTEVTGTAGSGAAGSGAAAAEATEVGEVTAVVVAASVPTICLLLNVAYVDGKPLSQFDAW